MIEKVITVKSSKEAGKPDNPYLEIIDQDDVRFSVWEHSLWNSLSKDASARVGYETKGRFKNIIQVEAMDHAIAETLQEEQPKIIEPQEFGMCVKEIGSLIRDNKLSDIYGKENAIQIVKWYRGYLSSTLKFPYDGTKLPMFDKKGEKTE